MIGKEPLFATKVLLLIIFIFGVSIGNILGKYNFISANYGKEFVIIEKTIKKNEFSYKISDGKRTFDLTTTDNLEMKDVITIGVK